MDRRSLIKHAGIAGVLAAAAAPAVHAQPVVRWRMPTSFPKSLDVLFGAGEIFAKTVREMSGGKFEISVHAAGELMPAFGIVDGIQNGTVEMGLTVPYYYTGKDMTFALGSAVPFGLTARQMNAWLEQAGGRALLDEFYAQYNIRSLSAGNTGTQMGGWYRKEIKTVQDLAGLKMRMGGGLFGETMQRLGVVSQNMPAGEIYQALEKGTLDAVEFVGPHDDQKLGLNKVAPNYYYPGWWEAGPEVSFFFNTKVYDGLSSEFKAMLHAASAVAAQYMLTRYDALNPVALKKLVADGTKLRSFPKEILDVGFKTVMEVTAEHEAKSPTFKKIHQSMRNFQRDQIIWERVSEIRYNNYMASIKF